MRNDFLIFSIISVIIVVLVSIFILPWFWWVFVLLGPIILVGVYDMIQKRHAIMRNFPVFGRGRYWMEWLRPKIYQYYVESETDGRPISRMFRSIVYQRSKKELSTTPFGTKFDVYAEGYEWMNHSINALDAHQIGYNPRILIGGPDCSQKYSSSVLNVSAMSFGSLSKNAIMALNGGAKIGDFAHNTGEGGVSPYHDRNEGDLIYQLGTGYFGSRTLDGNFSPELFEKRANTPNIKMIEIKLSQGAKPGHGGILPAKKVTSEIAAIRNIKMGEDVISPSYHKAFSTPLGLLKFIDQLRTLSNGKPIGFKFCVGHKSEFLGICKAMIETGIKPDFITVDGGEGGTGAAPLEFSNSVGTPLFDGLAFVVNTLRGFNLKKDISVLSSGKVITGFHIFRSLALGADACYAARSMMLALGCIQALECNNNRCPTGVATQDPEYVIGLDVNDKKIRVANYHKDTIKSFVELMAAAGIADMKNIDRTMVNRRIIMNQTQRFDEIYPYIPSSCLLNDDTIPRDWEAIMNRSNSEQF